MTQFESSIDSSTLQNDNKTVVSPSFHGELTDDSSVATSNPVNEAQVIVGPILSVLINGTVSVSDMPVLTSDIPTTIVNTPSPQVNDSFTPSLHLSLQPNYTSQLTTSNWFYGPPRFREYMNTNFSRIQSNPRLQKKMIVYQKKGTTGMAGQMTGVCDALLLAILHDRPFQSRIKGRD